MMTISEGATIEGGEMILGGEADAYGHRKLGGIGQITGELLKERTGKGIIYQQVGYLMRSGSPDSLDLMVATNYAVMAPTWHWTAPPAAWSRCAAGPTPACRSRSPTKASSESTSTSSTTRELSAEGASRHRKADVPLLRFDLRPTTRCEPERSMPGQAPRFEPNDPDRRFAGPRKKAPMAKVIGVLTAGGDCPGLNAVIRGVATRATEVHDAEVLGIRNGWEGLMEGRTMPLDRDAVRGILTRGGTILGTSRMDPYVHGDGLASCQRTIQRNGIDTLIVIGGDGTLASALKLSEEGLPVIGVPKTIDNDINGTDITFGFDTAVQIASDAIDRSGQHRRSPQPGHRGRGHGKDQRVDRHLRRHFGRRRRHPHPGAPLRPQRGRRHRARPPSPRQELLDHRGRRRGRAAAGHADGDEDRCFGFARLGGVGYAIAADLEELTGFETRVSVLGHIQRGGTPTAFDRVLATRLGVAAADLAVEGQSGVMVAVRSMNIEPVSMEEACAEVRGVPPELFDTAATFFQ